MIHDISPPLSPRLAVWPGDVPLRREVQLTMANGDAVTLSALRTTAHLGAHADAPSHMARDGLTIDRQPLDLYLGPCQVLPVPVPPGTAITPAMLPAAITAPRLLLATGTYPDAEEFREDFAALSGELVHWLHGQGVRLVGIDTPSVDLFPAADLPAHRACAACGIAILEGLVLRAVPAGTYELIALPLKLEGFDGSPVRAVLREAGAGFAQPHDQAALSRL